MRFASVNNCEYPLVVLVLCIFGTCRAFVVPAEVFHTCVLMLIFLVHSWVFFLKGPRAYVCAVSSFDFDVLTAARCVRSSYCDHHHKHNTAFISTVGSGATLSTYSRRVTTLRRSVVQMTRRTVRGHVRLEQEQDWWNQTHVPSHQVGEQERSEQRSAPVDSSEVPEQFVQSSPPMPLQLMNTPCHSGEHSESKVPERSENIDDQQRQWLQIQPWYNGDSWNQHGIVASRSGHGQNHSWDQWSRWNVNDWNQWSSWSARGNDDGWSSRSQWNSEQKKYFDKSPPPEWDGNHPE